MGPGDGHELLDPLIITPQLGGNLRGLIAHDVQQAIQSRPIKKGEIYTLGLDVLNERGKVGALVLLGSADVIGNVALFEVIKDIRATIHTARAQRTFLLREIEERNVLEGDVIEIKIAAEIQLHFDEFGEPAAENAAAGDPGGQPAKNAQGLKR